MATDGLYSEHMNLVNQLKQREDSYLEACKKYQCKIDAGALVTIRNELESYKPSIKLCDNDLIAVCYIFSEVDHVRTLDLRQNEISCNGAYLLCELLRKNKNIETIDLRYNKISDLGAQALSEILQIKGTKLKTLILHYNFITECGAFHIAQGLKINTILEELDISHNCLGSYGAKIIRAALMERSMIQHTKQLMIESPLNFHLNDQEQQKIKSNHSIDYQQQHEDSPKHSPKNSPKTRKTPKFESDEKTSGDITSDITDIVPISTDNRTDRRARSSMLRSPYRPNKQLLQKWISPYQLEYIQSQLGIFIKFDGNFVKEEVFNSITHGLGLLLSIIASFILMNVSFHYSSLCQIACGIFCFTLFFMYLSSTLFHSFLYAPCARHVFHVLDFSSIFLLIAGTYTPILLIGFSHSPFHSLILFMIMWLIAICGVTYSGYADPHDSKWKKLMYLYLAMSYSGLVCAKPFVETFATMAWVWIISGGVFYTAGVWFIANDATVPIFHSIWHICVIFGSACHFFCILWYIVPMDTVERPIHDLTFKHVIDNIFFALPISKLFTSDIINNEL